MPSENNDGSSSPSSSSNSGQSESGSDSGSDNGSNGGSVPVPVTVPVPVLVPLPVPVPVSVPVPTDLSGSLPVSVPASDKTIPVVVPIVSTSSSVTTTGEGYAIVQESGKSADGADITRVTFDTTNPELYDPQIYENLSEVVDIYDTVAASQTSVLLDQIKLYAGQIQCSDFHGKGTIDDYTTLFQAAGRIATESKQIELDVDIEGFNEFANAADELSELFSGFIIKLQNINIITDITFLTSISIALGKIVNLSNIFGKFKQSIFATTAIKIPKSAHDTKVVIEGVMSELNCAMQYINHFVAPTGNLHDADLSAAEKNIIAKSVDTIDNWNNLCEHGVSIAMSDNVDIQYIQHASIALKQTTVNLKSAASTLKAKLAAFNRV